mmetsp:Transcript_8461/g.15155  ORF Transcript_8461/g.15155 Transcript_8461/m.15155 type:complete len:134 (-) Transcript_8461:229-630(-)
MELPATLMDPLIACASATPLWWFEMPTRQGQRAHRGCRNSPKVVAGVATPLFATTCNDADFTLVCSSAMGSLAPSRVHGPGRSKRHAKVSHVNPLDHYPIPCTSGATHGIYVLAFVLHRTNYQLQFAIFFAAC